MNARDKIRFGADHDAASLLDAIRIGTDNRREFGWPGKPDVKVAVRLLSATETLKARTAVHNEFKDAGLDMVAHLDVFRAQEAAHGLCMALIDPSDNKPLFRSVADLRDFVSDDELAALSNEYNILCEECDPRIHELTEDDASALLGMLKKSPDLIPGKVQSLPVAWMLLRTLAKQQMS